MLRRLLIFNALCVFFVSSLSVVRPGPAFPPTKGEVWPKPQQQKKRKYLLQTITFSFQIYEGTDVWYPCNNCKSQEKGKTCDILKTAIERYSSVLKSTHHLAWRHSKKVSKHVDARWVESDPSYKGTLEELQINLSAPCEAYPHLDMHEKYSLNVSKASTLNSDSIWGILRGMETFAQLFYMANGLKDVFINTTQIVDFPRYIHRGLLMDTSRHYLSVANILKTLHAMEMNKMNVLHWHIVDDQSFPYQSEKFPQLSEQGAYDPSMVYTKTNINQIVTYARDRGIRVVPEFDMPGHTRSWGVAYPEILTKCYKSDKIIGLGPMDPTNNSTYKMIGDLFREVQERFPDKYLHLGGDEVGLDCWLSNPEILKFMQQHNMSRGNELHAYFMTNVIPLLGQKSKQIVWQEVFDEGVKLPSDAVVQVWKTVGAADMIPILSANHKLIYSASWYLDYLDRDWTKFYTADPRQMMPKDNKDLDLNNILGGEACMWGEAVDDTNFTSRVWPRTSAVAEKLWSAETPRYNNYRGVADEVAFRLEEHACRMNRRGVHAQPPNDPGFCVGGISDSSNAESLHVFATFFLFQLSIRLLS